MVNFPEKEKLEEAFNSDPFEGSINSKSVHNHSFDKLPSIASYGGAGQSEHAYPLQIEQKVFKRKKVSHGAIPKPKALDKGLDPARVIVYK